MSKESWRTLLPPHPAAELLPRMSEGELRELGEDILHNGMTAPIAIWCDGSKFRLLDGISRLDALEMVGVPVASLLSRAGKGWAWGMPNPAPANVGPHSQLVGRLAPPTLVSKKTDPYTFAISMNLVRRHLSSEQKRTLVSKLLALKPESSDRQIGKLAGVNNKTVAVVRKEKERREEIPHVDARVDSKGRKQPRRKVSAPAAPYVASVNEWRQRLRPMRGGNLTEVARQILAELAHYRKGCFRYEDDCQILANAIVAWEQLGEQASARVSAMN
jgi:hypothetical protein